MRDEFTNRLTMFLTSLGVLHKPERKPAWFNVAPLIFTTKVAGTVSAVDDLGEWARKQGLATTGAAEDKDAEETLLETLVFKLSCSVVSFLRDHNNATDAATVDFPLSYWRKLRDQDLILKARTVHGLVKAAAEGPTTAEATKYDLTTAVADELDAEIKTYGDLVTAPQ